MVEKTKIGLALSGGGSRAVAFHLGCMRALRDHGILERVSLLSSVSGGSVIAALYAYYDDDFMQFDERTTALLRQGLLGGIVRQTLFSPETPKIVGTQLTAGLASLAGSTAALAILAARISGIKSDTLDRLSSRVRAPLLRRASRTTAFERHLRKGVFGNVLVDDVKRKGLKTIINAAELRTGTAFRFGSDESGCWRYGKLSNVPSVSKAVAASAAYPALLPALDERLEFENKGTRSKHRVVITDGGVYDNLALTPLLPGRSKEYSTNVSEVDFIICCDAGQGIPTGAKLPYFWRSRMLATIGTIHRRTHALSYQLLHELNAANRISGFILPYLGQIDSKLPFRPGDLVKRETTYDYPTDFSPMSERDIELLSKRGEQLTTILIQHYCSTL